MIEGSFVFNFAFCCHRACGPMDCLSLQDKVAMDCKQAEDHIMQKWYPKVIKTLKSKHVTKVEKAKMRTIYRCAFTLLSNQVRHNRPDVELDFDSRRAKRNQKLLIYFDWR